MLAIPTITMTDDEKKLDNAQKNQRDIGAAEDDPHTTGPAENLREEAADMVDDENSRDPMSPENITEHDPTAVKREQGSEIVEEGNAGTTSKEAQDKYRKKGMTEV
jgi:hypothetical protein